MNVGGLVIPGVELASRGVKVLPHLTAIKDCIVGLLEHFGSDHFAGYSTDLVARWPNVSQEDIISGLVFAKSLRLEVEVDSASESVGHNEGR